ncbi:SNF2 family N-terminal domain-containing protein [Xylogone sp. PMI_703]|nr:SNF2 family N-terminal domain-containing protein [Xylogone sp. PMI_703]
MKGDRFAPLNTFSQKTPGSPSKRKDHSDQEVDLDTSTTNLPVDFSESNLPRLHRSPSSHSIAAWNNKHLEELGDSSSLFSEGSSLLIDGTIVSTEKFTPAKHSIYPLSRTEKGKMDSERAKSNVPTFGQPSLPQSPLAKIHQKSSNLFIQPKARPEHHRVEDKSSHPHTQTFKDVTRKVIDPLVPRAPSAYNIENKYVPPPGAPAPVQAPTYYGSQFTTTRAAPRPMYSSMGGAVGGFSSVNVPSYRNTYVDLTLNEYPDEISDPYTFVDPAKAAEDLKALLEGALDDDDEEGPKTRSRRKKQISKADTSKEDVDDLTAAVEHLDVTSDGEDEDDGTVKGINVKLLPHQVEGVEWMRGRELGTGKKGRVPKGGILADDMGLGKTLQSISLIVTNPRPEPTDEEFSKRKLPSGIEKATLVVAPLSLIRQWELEIKEKVSDSHFLRVCVHHGPQRTKRFQDLKKYDIVITTYQILVSEFGSSSEKEDGIKVGCFGLHWYRVILDEAHSIKNRNAKATKACYALRSEYRWCLTGTPMQNNLDELQSLIKFLRIKPYDNLAEWKDQIDRPMKNGRGDVSIKRLRHYLKIFMKRRTKDILKKDGALNPGGKPSAAGEGNKTGFKVTQRKIETVSAELSPQERLFYSRLEQRTGHSIEEMMSGKVNYASALVLLLRLRQACNHPILVGGKLTKDSEALAGDVAASSSKKSKASAADMDEIADMFGSLDVGTKKCEICQMDLSEKDIAKGEIHCSKCVEDLELVTGKKHKKSKKDKTSQEAKEERSDKSSSQAIRKQRNRAVVLDSDDEDDDEASGDPEEASANNELGDSEEDAEGGGEWLESDADETFPDIQVLSQRALEEKAISETSDPDSSSENESEFDEDNKKDDLIPSTKIKYLLKILRRESDEHKFIVFSQFTSMLDLIEPFLRKKDYQFTRYDGKMRNDLREASLNKLRNDDNCRILLCSLKCGSLGLNLTAATRVVILEPFWNPFVEEQAIDRVHRLTQKIDVVVYKITIKDSVEERILDLQEKKRQLANETIEGGKLGAGKLGMNEILQLFKRDAESSPLSLENVRLASKMKLLNSTNPEDDSGNAYSSRETSVARERKSTPPVRTKKEDAIFGRRW